MAKTVKLANYIKPPKPSEKPLSRRGKGKPAGLYLLELRTHASQSRSGLSRPKVVIPVDLKGGPESFPEAVKITHS